MQHSLLHEDLRESMFCHRRVTKDCMSRICALLELLAQETVQSPQRRYKRTCMTVIIDTAGKYVQGECEKPLERSRGFHEANKYSFIR